MIISLLQEIKEILLNQQLMSKPILNVRETAIYLGVSENTIYHFTSTNKLTYYKPSGKLLYFKKHDLDAFLLQNRIEKL